MYPNKKLLYAFITARDSIHLEFTTPEEADCVLQGWRTEFFGGDSQVRRASDRNEQHSAVIRGVQLEVSDSDMTSALTDNFPDVRIRRFEKSDKQSLQTVELTYPSKTQIDKATIDAIFIDHLYYQPVELIQQEIRIIRCYRCQKFGTSVSIAIRKCHANIAPASTLSTTAKVISLPGVPIAAEATKQILLTAQLILNRYKKFMRREVYEHRLRETLCQKMMAIHGFTFLQNNICGLSDHSKIALNQNLQQTKADIVFFDEIKTHISANLFDNFTTFICMGGSSGSVAILLKNHIPYSRLNQLEDSSIDNVVLPVRLGGIKLVVSTAYVIPDDFEGLRKIIKVRQSCKTYVDKRCPNGALFW